ncbi:chitin synthase activator [Sporothrix brasiliensis 5110]|uniref:Chitin synthase activator n=1 Tax=Sporothrix brasiliensis 5110 TaxID=1398154 RepID=A0A0C2IPT8_9PEZI|nr:chitin synthase activator [Sporothrix brasiliensis 5110]KIH88955.1 chitin synthase activator [Sporothrix brasiliensis 5110]
MPKLEATFVPGGYDDYYMPEVIAPSPQRVMPEVPQNMQDGLQRMELEARQPSNLPTTATAAELDNAPATRQVPSQQHGREPSLSTYVSGKPAADIADIAKPAGRGASPAANQQAPAEGFKAFAQDKDGDMASNFEVPSFSPFPRISQGNVPPSDDEKERILYNARQEVLKSNNVAVQLDWALDVLSWVEISQEAHARDNKDQGKRPQTPRIEHELRLDAINIVEYLSSQNHPQALFSRSKWLEFGKFGFRQDRNEAFLGYMNAASRGWGRAEYRMGMIYENSNDIKKALQHYNRGLEMEDSASSYRLGMMNLLGQHGHTKDFSTGLEMIRSAADTSDEESPQGAYVYGMLISRELPDITIPEGMLPFDVAQARQYIEKSAYFGFAKAQLKMGQAYELCHLGCDFNPALSLHYYGLAAHQGQPEAALGVSRWFLFGYDGVFLKNEQLAFKYAQQAADAKLATGEFAMGYYYEIGIFVQKDLRDARSWYERAAEHGNQDAINRLEGLSQAKTLTKQDHETTALTRIKSKHGSMRGQRPERFGSRQKDVAAALPTLAESTPNLPTESAPPSSSSPDYRPPSSHNISPAQRPVQDTPGAARPPAFSINIDQSSVAIRPKSTAPYPVDDKPAPLNLARPKSTAPYPDDGPGGRAPLSPHYNPQIRASNGQQAADRPLSAFGIRPTSMNPQGGPRPLPVSQATGNLAPDQRPFSVNIPGRPLDNDPRGRITSAGWEPQIPTGGYRGTSPNAPQGRADYNDSYDYGHQQQHPQPPPHQQAPASARLSGGMPSQASDNSRNRLSKSNPNANPSAYGAAQTGNPAAQPGRDYGPRTSSRPVSNVYPGPSSGTPRPDRIDSLPSQVQGGHGHYPSGGGGSGPQMYKNRPQLAEHGRQSAPPAQMSGGGGMGPGPGPATRPVSTAPPPRVSSAAPQAAPGKAARPSAPASAQAPKPVKQGPATFEEMGIPQGKGDDDCVIM